MAYNESYKRWNQPRQNHFNESGNLKKGETHQGFLHKIYKLRFPEKYIGDPNLIIYRSGWELAFCRWCDSSPSIIHWSSEPTKIPYYDRISKLDECKKYGLNPNDPKNWEIKNYNVDFWVQVKKDEETTEKWFIEIKPSEKLKKPVPPLKTAPLREQRKFVKDAKDYLINEAKWAAMNAYANKVNAKFYIFTEVQLEKMAGKFFISIWNHR
jgi:hypothetical protein